MNKLWNLNTPQNFWKCQPNYDESLWEKAIQNAKPILDFSSLSDSVDVLIAKILGEEQFGDGHWKMSLPKKIYYDLKPFLPRPLTKLLRRIYGKGGNMPIGWPVEDRYVRFLWETLRQLLILSGKERIFFRNFWPANYAYALVLTHDIETEKGQAQVRKIVELETEYGFRSSFNFVPERYKLDLKLIQDLQDRGFEVGIHGLKHDGKLFSSKRIFDRRIKKINQYLRKFNSVGFRAPLTHRNPYWMQSLQVEYDLSFFDTDPFEPMPGGTMSIWPFMMGAFVELPYTLPQDYTLIEVLNDKSPKVWLDKAEFIAEHFGMVLLNSHPDYLLSMDNWDIYAGFLREMKYRGGYWHALPKDVAAWWRDRLNDNPSCSQKEPAILFASVVENKLVISR